MKLRILAAGAAALSLMSVAAAADAAITVSARTVNELYQATGQTIIEDFDGNASPSVQYLGHIQTIIETPIQNSAPPPYSGPGSTVACCSGTGNFDADATDYASVQMGQVATLNLLNGHFMTSFSFYMGSPDDYNHVVFHFLAGGSQAFDGDDIWGANGVLGDGDRNKGFRVYYDFAGAKVNKITFTTENTNAFEFDGLAANGVPEPATWALMIGGFGMAGAMLRRRRAALA